MNFHLVVSDPDARIISHGVEFGDELTAMLAPAAVFSNNRFGPWTPPAPQPDRETYDEQHVYASPGTYTVTAYAWSADNLPGDTSKDPYGSGGEPWRVVVVVR